MEIVLLKAMSSHPVAQSDMRPKIQMGSINDNGQMYLKVFQHAHSACGAELAASKPFAPECEKTNANPGGVETGGGVGFEIE